MAAHIPKFPPAIAWSTLCYSGSAYLHKT